MTSGRTFLVVVVFLGCGTTLAQSRPDDDITKLFRQYCFDCHASDQAEGGLRLDTLTSDVAFEQPVWRRVLEVLSTHEMPPREEPQPPMEDAEKVVKRIHDGLHRAALSARNVLPMRRLDADEYRNTIRDLLKLNVGLFDPTREFPKEIGPAGREVVSLDALMEHYLEAAHAVIERAVHPEPRPEKKTLHFHGKFSEQRSLCAELLGREDCETLFVRSSAINPTYLFPRNFKGTSGRGRYRIKLRAQSYSPPEYFGEIEGIMPGEPLRLAIEFRTPSGPAAATALRNGWGPLGKASIRAKCGRSDTRIRMERLVGRRHASTTFVRERSTGEPLGSLGPKSLSQIVEVSESPARRPDALAKRNVEDATGPLSWADDSRLWP